MANTRINEYIPTQAEKEESAAFTKHDTGKNKLSLILPEFIVEIGEVLTSGAAKYPTPDNWKKCDDPSRYKDSLLRHIYAYLGGEKIDPETGKSHLVHAACNLMFLYWFDDK